MKERDLLVGALEQYFLERGLGMDRFVSLYTRKSNDVEKQNLSQCR